MAAHLPTMLHVLWLVHADGQFDPQVLVRAGLCHGHLVELGLLGAVGGRVEDDLRSANRRRRRAVRARAGGGQRRTGRPGPRAAETSSRAPLVLRHVQTAAGQFERVVAETRFY